ncbi:hypothetical protein FACS189432_00770 [Bacteroidia bacterium]|nr:hypothetical protein FACS189432_00770 [Bacteroidia bacterium]
MRKNVWIATILLVISSFSVEITAQEHIAALVKKCETIDSVEINVIREKNAKTSDLQAISAAIRIHSNPDLIKEFLEAFQKDERKATETVAQKQEGKIYLNYKFGDIFYSLNLQKKENREVMEVRMGKRTEISKRMQEMKIELAGAKAALSKRKAELAKKRTELAKRKEQSSKEREKITKLRKEQAKERTKLIKEQEKERAKLKKEIEKEKK